MASRRKRNQTNVIPYLQNIEQTAIQIQQILINGWNPSEYSIKVINDPKLRLIYSVPFFPDRIIHHAIMNILEPIFSSRMIYDSYSCRKGKGQHLASKRCMQFTMRYQYVLQCDCSQFYINIDHEILKEIYRWKINDVRVLNMLDALVDSISVRDNNINILNNMIAHNRHKEQAEIQIAKLMKSREEFGNIAGEAIGNLMSQWDGNLYMTEFDYYVKQELKCNAYLRYCDDFLLFSDDKKQLHEWQSLITSWLYEKRKLLLSKSIIIPTDTGIDFCGYRHFNDGKILVRKRTARSIAKRTDTVLDEIDNNKISAQHGYFRMISTKGTLKHAHTYNLRKSIGFDTVISGAKKRYDEERNKTTNG